MSNILITGASGFIGRQFASSMAHDRRYERPGHERDPVYDISRIREELGFVPERSVLRGS